MKSIPKFIYIIVGVFLCIFLEYIVYITNHRYHLFEPFFSFSVHRSIEVHEGENNFINPLLECSSEESDNPVVELNISKVELNNLVNEIIKSRKSDFMSIYFRDLNNGPWIGINEKEEFIGASLLKVPVMITYFEKAESNPDILNQVIKYDKEYVSNEQHFTPSKQIEIGKSYKVQELLDYMIYYSDNNATYLLFEDMTQKDFNRVFSSLGVGKPRSDKPYAINTKTYASFFRILFNSSYLSREYSEKALETLSKIEFDKGISSPIPKNIIVSHKFGVWSDNTVKQLHDCGIVYYPDHPYIICVISRGKNFEDLAESISSVSKFIYDQVSKIKE